MKLIAVITVVLSADRFLHKMVRSIVGACFDVARGARPPGLAQGILDDTYRGEWTWLERPRRARPRSAPGRRAG